VPVAKQTSNLIAIISCVPVSAKEPFEFAGNFFFYSVTKTRPEISNSKDIDNNFAPLGLGGKYLLKKGLPPRKI
jgi:hypothetical protein